MSNLSKLTTLEQLKLLAQRAHSADEALGARIDTLVEEVEGLVTAGGEPNVLEGVKVNGAALSIANKMVDILIAEGSANGTVSVNGVDVAVKGLQALAFKAQVSESDLDTALKAVITAKAAQSDLDALGVRVTTAEGKLTTLIGEDAGKSVRAISAEEVAKIVANAPEAYDTLKELADWLSSHETDAAGMNSSIQDNKKAIEDLAALVGELPEGTTSTNVVAYIAEAIAAIGIGDYAKTSEMNAAISSALENYYTKSEVDAKVKAVDDKFANYTNTEGMNAAIKAVDDKFVNYSTTAQMNSTLEGYATDAEAEAAASAAVTAATATDAEVSAMLDEVFGA